MTNGRLQTILLGALTLAVAACASAPEYHSVSRTDAKGVPFTAEGMFLDGYLVDGKVTYGTSGPDSHVWQGKRSGGLLNGTLVRGDGRRFEGLIQPDAHDSANLQYVSGRDTRLDGCVHEGNFKNQELSGPGKITCPERTLQGTFQNGKLHGKGSITWANGDKIENANFENGKFSNSRHTLQYADGRKLSEYYDYDGTRSGLATLDYPNGDKDELLYWKDVLLEQLPVVRQAGSLPPCAALPADWQLLKGSCAGGKPTGEVELWHKSGRRISATFKDGQPTGNSTLVWMDKSDPPLVVARSLSGKMDAQLRFSQGFKREAGLDADGKGRAWYWDWEGPFVNNLPHGDGRCAYQGKAEPCNMAQGARVDAVHQQRQQEAAVRSAQAIAHLDYLQQREDEARARRAADRERERAAAYERQNQAAEDMRRAASRSPGVFSPEASAKTAREYQAIAESNARMHAQIQAAKQQLARESADQRRVTNEGGTRRGQESQPRSEVERQVSERVRSEPAQDPARPREQAAREEAARSSSPVAPPAAKPVVTVPEAVAVCHRNAQDYWFCDGPVQKTSVGDKGDAGLRSQLSLAGCANPRSDRPSPDGQGKLFLCGTGLKVGARDVPKLRGFTTERQTYRCEGGNCSALSDSREVAQ